MMNFLGKLCGMIIGCTLALMIFTVCLAVLKGVAIVLQWIF